MGYIGGPNILDMRVNGISAAGQRRLTVVYETAEPRVLQLGINSSPARTLRLAGAGDWLTPATTSLTVFLPAGDSWIKFFNDTGPAPDINRIVIS